MDVTKTQNNQSNTNTDINADINTNTNTNTDMNANINTDINTNTNTNMSIKTKKEKERVAGLDLVRTIAALFVICVHFFLNCGYYYVPMEGMTMFVMTCTRWLFMTCVPLFILLTGYFKINKKLEITHYKSLIPILVAYFVISILKIFASNQLYGTVYSFGDAMRNLFNYQMAWYVGMYVALMLMAPFFNVMWHALTLKQKKWLIISLVFITNLYPIVRYVAPSYWQMLYPLTYYFIGAYIREQQPKIKKWIGGIILLLIVVAEAAGSYIYSKHVFFKWDFLGGVDNGYNTFTVVICAVILFLCFYDVKIKNRFINRLLEAISGVSLEIYLFAGIFDAYIYYYAKRYIEEGEAFFKFFIPLVLLSFIGALVASLIYQKLYQLIIGGIKDLIMRKKEKIQK
ncbi:MAG: acyltransferase family protein [Clostridia bacterium]|nr:acyltransferase family protein [Clostridia bacterium]